MVILTEEQLAEIDRIIRETKIVTDTQEIWNGDYGVDWELDDAEQTLARAARHVREYLTNLRGVVA